MELWILAFPATLQIRDVAIEAEEGELTSGHTTSRWRTHGCGEGGIRTHEPPCGSYFLSREAPSTGLGHLSIRNQPLGGRRTATR